MSAESPCRCWYISPPVPHFGHCCLRDLPADYRAVDELACGHLAEGLAIDVRRKAGAS